MAKDYITFFFFSFDKHRTKANNLLCGLNYEFCFPTPPHQSKYSIIYLPDLYPLSVLDTCIWNLL
ncbi:hypothetical protein QR98_0085080 [Sarcoptes scabiei]|uniref:Uncharacterized protein n=1 Tax=Sarcoptes scabiei TaxID=52283 RepID=A0A132AG52_SARSC|nr:hypothetical protein QR98_0085080 [Sarcoptes scabiei]